MESIIIKKLLQLLTIVFKNSIITVADARRRRLYVYLGINGGGYHRFFLFVNGLCPPKMGEVKVLAPVQKSFLFRALPIVMRVRNTVKHGLKSWSSFPEAPLVVMSERVQ